MWKRPQSEQNWGGGWSSDLEKGLEMFIGFDKVMETYREILAKSNGTDNELQRLPFKKKYPS